MAHRIDFAQFDVIVFQIGSPGIHPQVIVSWTIEPVRGTHDIEFRVERSQTPNFDDDSVESITAPVAFVPGQVVYDYLDTTVNIQSLWRRWYYRIVATDNDTSREYASTVKTWESDPKVFELEIIARHDWLLRYETGTPCFAFVERTSGGGFCQDCYNVSLGRSSKSNCTTCMGTGRERPFYEAILTFIDFNPPAKVSSIQSLELQSGQTNVWWSAYPQLKPRDVLVEVLSGKRWRVARMNPVGDVRTDIQHFATVEQINPRDVEYKLAIPASSQRSAVNALEAMKAERRF